MRPVHLKKFEDSPSDGIKAVSKKFACYFRNRGLKYILVTLATGLLIVCSTTLSGCANMPEYDPSKEPQKGQKHERGGRGRGA